MGTNSGQLTQSDDISSLDLWPKGLKNKTIIVHPTTYTNKTVKKNLMSRLTNTFPRQLTLKAIPALLTRTSRPPYLSTRKAPSFLILSPLRMSSWWNLGDSPSPSNSLTAAKPRPSSRATRVGSKYTFLDQIQIQLGQIKFKYIAFPDFKSNTITNFNSNTLLFIQIRFKYISCEYLPLWL